MAETLNIHAVIPASRVNGPGTRLVVFFQGCLRDCPGCFNPGTHSFEKRDSYTAREIFDKFLTPAAKGLTVSGGEPFMQPRGLISLLKEARERGLSTAVYTGYTIEEIRADERLSGALELTDVLIDGAFVEDKKETTLLARGSTNQKLNFLTGRYSMEDFYMPGKVEVTIARDGSVVETGFSRVIF